MWVDGTKICGGGGKKFERRIKHYGDKTPDNKLCLGFSFCGKGVFCF